MKFQVLKRFSLPGYDFRPHPEGKKVIYEIKSPSGSLREALRYHEEKGFLTQKIDKEYVKEASVVVVTEKVMS